MQNYKMNIDEAFINGNIERVKEFVTFSSVKECLIKNDLDKLYEMAKKFPSLKKLKMGQEDFTILMTEFLTYSGIDILNYLTTIPQWCFAGSEIYEINIPENIEFIGPQAFQYCWDLGEVVIPGNVKVVSREAFYDCGNLTKVEFEEGVEAIGKYCFQSTHDKICFYMPNSLKYIDYPITSGKSRPTFFCHEGSFAQEWCEATGSAWERW